MATEYFIGAAWILYGGSLGAYMFSRARSYERSRHSLELQVLNAELESDENPGQSLSGVNEDPSLLTVLGVSDLGLLNDLLGVENRTLAEFERRQANLAPLDLPLYRDRPAQRRGYPRLLKAVTYGIILCDFLALNSFVFANDVLGDSTVAQILGNFTLSHQELSVKQQYVALWGLIGYFCLLCVAVVSCGLRRMAVLLALVEVLIIPLCNACFSLMVAPFRNAPIWDDHWLGLGPEYATLGGAVLLVLLAYPTAISCGMNSIFWSCRAVSVLPTFGVGRVLAKFVLCAVNSWLRANFGIVVLQGCFVLVLLVANVQLMPWLGRWVRVNHVYSAMLSSVLACTVGVCVLKAVDRFVGEADIEDWSLAILLGSLPLGLLFYYHYANRLPYSKLSEAVIYRMNAKTLERDLPELLRSIASHGVPCCKPHYARQGLLKLCLGWTRDDVRVLAARAVAVVARCSMLSGELLTALSRARKDPCDAVSASVRMTLIDLREFGLLRLKKDLGEGQAVVDRSRACDTIERLAELFNLSVTAVADQETYQLMLSCMCAPEETLQSAGFRACASVIAADNLHIIQPMLTALQSPNPTRQTVGLALLALSTKQQVLASQLSSHLELSWGFLSGSDAVLSAAAARVFHTLQAQPHFSESLRTNPWLSRSISSALERGSACPSYDTAAQLTIGLAEAAPELLGPWVSSRLHATILEPSALDTQMLAVVSALQGTPQGRTLLSSSSLFDAVAQLMLRDGATSEGTMSAVLVAARILEADSSHNGWQSKPVLRPLLECIVDQCFAADFAMRHAALSAIVAALSTPTGACVLGELPRVLPALEQCSRDEDSSVRCLVAQAIQAVGSSDLSVGLRDQMQHCGSEILHRLAADNNWCVRTASVATLRQLASTPIGGAWHELPLLLHGQLKDDISDVREAALAAMSHPEAWGCGSRPYTEYAAVLELVVVCFQSDPRDYVRAAAASALAAAGVAWEAAKDKAVGMFVSSLVTEDSQEVMSAVGQGLAMVLELDPESRDFEVSVHELLMEHTHVATTITHRIASAAGGAQTGSYHPEELLGWLCVLRAAGSAVLAAVVRCEPGTMALLWHSIKQAQPGSSALVLAVLELARAGMTKRAFFEAGQRGTQPQLSVSRTKIAMKQLVALPEHFEGLLQQITGEFVSHPDYEDPNARELVLLLLFYVQYPGHAQRNAACVALRELVQHAPSFPQAVADTLVVDLSRVQAMGAAPMSHNQVNLWSWNNPVVFGLFMKLQGMVTSQASATDTMAQAMLANATVDDSLRRASVRSSDSNCSTKSCPRVTCSPVSASGPLSLNSGSSMWEATIPETPPHLRSDIAGAFGPIGATACWNGLESKDTEFRDPKHPDRHTGTYLRLDEQEESPVAAETNPLTMSLMMSVGPTPRSHSKEGRSVRTL